MSLLPAFDIGLAALMLALAWWVVAARGAVAAAIGFVACGLLLSLVWFRMGAPDVALTEAAVGGGVTGALLVAAAAKLRRTEAAIETERPPRWFQLAAAVACAAVAIAIAYAVLALPRPAPSLAPAAAAVLPATGLGNPVTAVLMAFRALDTLLEKVVLVLALVGVWSLAPDALWPGRPGAAPPAEGEGPLVFLARLLPPVGIVVGIHLLWTSSDHPGGAFQGGTVLAAMFVLAWMAGLADMPAIGGRAVRLAAVAGALVFTATGVAGIVLGGSFLAYPPGLAKPAILLVEAAKIVSVAAAMALLLAGPPARPPVR